jgi:hypothetical protein
MAQLDSDEIDAIVVSLLENAHEICVDDRLYAAVRSYANAEISQEVMLARCFSDMYKVGLVGLKLSTTESYCWSTIGSRKISTDEINGSTGVMIHPAFWRVLGVSIRSSSLS